MDKRKYKRFTAGYYFDIDSDIADKVKIRDISISGICLETGNLKTYKYKEHLQYEHCK